MVLGLTKVGHPCVSIITRVKYLGPHGSVPIMKWLSSGILLLLTNCRNNIFKYKPKTSVRNHQMFEWETFLAFWRRRMNLIIDLVKLTQAACCVTNSSVYTRVTQKPRGRWLECQSGPIRSKIRAVVNSDCTGSL